MRQIQQHQALNTSSSINHPTSSLVLSQAQTKLSKIVKKVKQEYYQNVIRELDHKSIFPGVK